ncbi:hypothetical protein COLO4_21618 [Corchorus olitorius]|uniref:F-box associated beta-propeller type 1 domain-containing protein n=1 Tax=Corchorus olitorius TaxID=93759 RepID=A0A1R3IS73_9ROSI|nr:hypothetical protein COLO4_21618 [Corchorus olitorius]
MDTDGSNREVVAIDFGLDHYSNEAYILGSCNGLLLVSVNRVDFFLLNPSTGQHKKISSVHLSGGGGMVISGLGYDSTSRNYKGIIVSHSCSGPSSPHIIYDCVYDYNLNKWKKRFDEFPYGVNNVGSAAMVNGNPHWCVYRFPTQEEAEYGEHDGEFYVTYDVIVYFDLKTEEFKEVELPEWAVTPEIEFDVGVLGGCLCMSLHPQGSSTSIEVWAMKEYGIAESWTKLFVVNSSFFRPLLLRPICFTGTGRNEVLMEGTSGGEIIIFNLKEELEKLLALYKYRFKVCTYVESLVFPEQVGNEAELPQFGGNPIVDSDTDEMDCDADEMADEIGTAYRLDHQKLLYRLDHLDHHELLDLDCDADEIDTAYNRLDYQDWDADEIGSMDRLDHLDCDADEIGNAHQEDLLDCDGAYGDAYGDALDHDAHKIGSMDHLDCDAQEQLDCDADKIGNLDHDAHEIGSMDHLDCDADEIGNAHEELLDCDADEIGNLDHPEDCDGSLDQELLDCDVDKIGAACMCRRLDGEISAAYMVLDGTLVFPEEDGKSINP